MNITRVGALFMLAASLLAAADPFVGTWRLNTYKSKFPLGTPGILMATMQIEAVGDSLRSSASGADGAGIASDFTFTCALDGTPCKVTAATPTLRSDSSVDTVALKRANPNTIVATGTRDGKPVYSDRRVVSPDGKTLTVTRRGTTPDGKKYESSMVLDRIR